MISDPPIDSKDTWKNIFFIPNVFLHCITCAKSILVAWGAFTPDTNDLHVKSMQRRDRQSGGANGANYAAQIERFTCYSTELKNRNFGGCSRRVNQSGACSSSDVITSGGRKSQTTMEDKLIVVVCVYPELYNTTSYFYRNRNKFSNETGAACRSPSHDANSRLLCSEFRTRMKRISCANEASKLKMFKRPTTRE